MVASNARKTTGRRSNKGAAKERKAKPNNWTIMIYHSGDSDLGEEFVWALKDMLRVGTPETIEVVALMDSISPDLWQFTISPPTANQPAGGPAGRKPGQSAQTDGPENADIFNSKNAKIVDPEELGIKPKRKGSLAPESDANAASSTLLRNFVLNCIKEHPAQRFMLVLSGHASGMIGRSLLLDRGAGRFMSVPRLDWALGEMVEGISKSFKKTNPLRNDPRLDILGFDACGMMTAEVAFLLRDEVKYLVGSQGFMTMEGWPYHEILRFLKKRPEAEADELASEIIRRCVDYYTNFARVGVSVDMAACELDSAGWRDLASSLEALTRRLIAEVKSDNQQVINAIIAAHWYAQSYAQEQYVDLYDFCDQLRKTAPQFVRECKDIIDKLKRLVKISCFAGAGYQQSHGVSLYFPWVATDEQLRQYGTIPSRRRPFNRATKWGTFLKSFLKKTRRDARRRKGKLIFMPPPGYLDHLLEDGDGHRFGTAENIRLARRRISGSARQRISDLARRRISEGARGLSK